MMINLYKQSDMDNKHNSIKWNPPENFPENFPEILQLIGLRDDYEEFRLLFFVKLPDGTLEILRIKFPQPLSYRCVNLRNQNQNKNSKMSLNQWNLYTIESSDYLNWFHEEGSNRCKDWDIIHYVVQSRYKRIDLLSEAWPIIDIPQDDE